MRGWFSHDSEANLAPEGAWIYRKAFDHIVAAYEGRQPPSDQRYPQVAAGNWALMAATPELPVAQLQQDMQEQIALNSAFSLRVSLAALAIYALQGE